MSRFPAAAVKQTFDYRKYGAVPAWRAVVYAAIFAPYLFIVASLWMFPEHKWSETPDWRTALAQAEASREDGDLYSAISLYSRTARIASWQDDWKGLLAAACGMRRLDRKDSHANAHGILVRAMIAAEKSADQIGLSTIAKAFESIGERNAASMVLSRMRHDPRGNFNDASAGRAEWDCW